MHILFIGFDDSVFHNDAASDTELRFLQYALELNKVQQDSNITYLVISKLKYDLFEKDSVSFSPVQRNYVWVINVFFALLSIHKRKKIDIVSCQTPFMDSWPVLAFRWLYKVPSVVQIHFDLFSKHIITDACWYARPFMMMHVLLAKLLLKFHDGVRVVGNRVCEEIKKHGLHTNIRVIPVPVSLMKNEEEFPEKSEKPTVLFVGKLVPAKRIDVWIDIAEIVASRMPETIFEIVGDGPLMNEMMQKVKEKNLAHCIRFRGKIPYEDLPSVYKRASVFLLASSNEGFGRVIVEASSFGLPVVAPSITGVEDIVQPSKSGYLYKSFAVEEAANYVLKLLQDRNLAGKMGNYGADYVRDRFNPARLAHEWIGYLAEIAMRKS